MSATEDSLKKALASSITANPQKVENEGSTGSLFNAADSLRLSRTVSMATHMVQAFTSLFTGPVSATASSSCPLTESKYTEKALEALLGKDLPATLIAKIPELIKEGSASHPHLKTSESYSLQELMVRVGMQQRPQHFTHLEASPTLPEDANISVWAKFLQEFVQEGSLDAWIPHLYKSVADLGTAAATASFEFIQAVINLLRLMSSGEISDPAKDPLNKYVDLAILQRAIALRQWLKDNEGHRDYDINQNEFAKADKHVQESRERALKEASEYIFSLLKKMQPILNGMQTLEEVTAYKEAEWNTQKRAEFQTYVINEFNKTDIFEPVKLRAFWEKLQREQYGSICLEMICESFTEEYKGSQAHQIVRQIWTVSHLDTLHAQPQEAKSRMPGSSIDGQFAPNFGYKMAHSSAYQAWASQPLVRACGDVIVDAFHYVVDLGVQLNIEVFLDRFSMHISGSKKNQWKAIKNPHEYDSYMIAFELFLLEKVFQKRFIRGGNRTISGELLKASGNRENLLEKAKTALVEFKNFSAQMFNLRPSKAQLTEVDLFRGLVFGIGFNGQVFGSLDHSPEDKPQIWLTFSDSGRNSGGYLLLNFLIHVAKQRSNRLTSTLKVNPINFKYHFDRYKSLIKEQVNQTIKENYEVPDQQWDSHMLAYIKEERAKFEGFMSQLEQDISFENLDPKFKHWIMDPSNWYYLPSQAEVKIPEEMPSKEYEVQRFARTVLFDSLAQRPFSIEESDLMPFLFMHWKGQLIKLIAEHPIELQVQIQKANTLNDLTEASKEVTLKYLDQLIWQVHPQLKTSWDPAINYHFSSFMRPRIKSIDQSLTSTAQQIRKLEKQKTNTKNSEALSKIEELLNTARTQLENLQREKQNLATHPSALPRDEYEKFRNAFFEGREVSQCVEPLFARVLGHDRFFSVFISKKTLLTNIQDSKANPLSPLQLGSHIPQDVIAPCDKRCQHHALGHLYVGDLLSYQSADRLDKLRQIHGLGEVPDRFMVLEKLKTILESYQEAQPAPPAPPFEDEMRFSKGPDNAPQNTFVPLERRINVKAIAKSS